MRLFGAIQDNFKKVEAAEICKNLLEEHKSKGRFFDDPTSAAMELVWACWISYEHYFDGRHGQRAHKLALAAFAFANAVRVLRQGYNSDVLRLYYNNNGRSNVKERFVSFQQSRFQDF